MKKLNKTLLLASTLFVSQVFTLADNSYATEGYDLNVEPSTSTTLDNIDLEQPTEEVQPEALEEVTAVAEEANFDDIEATIAEIQKDLLLENSLTPQEDTTDLHTTEETSVIPQDLNTEASNEENTEDQEVEATEVESNEAIETTKAEVESNEVDEENEEVVYYNSRNLDEIFTIGEDKSSENTAVKEDTIEENTGYYGPTGAGVIVNENNQTRYYEDNKLVKNAQVIVNDKFYNIDDKGNATNPKALWTRIGQDIYYVNDNGDIARGITEVKNEKFYFNKDGILQRNKKVVTGESYYDVADNGLMVAPKDQWVSLNNKKYYNDKDGKLLKGIATVRDKTYYFDNNGVLTANKKILTSSSYYLVDKNGVATSPKNYWFNVSGGTYRTDSNGKLLTGLQKVDNVDYLFAKDGKMYQDKKVISAGKFYDIDKRGVVSNPKNAWVELDGQKYHTNESGYVKEGVWKIDNEYYYFTSNGLTPNQTVTQKGVLYTVDDKGIATKLDNNVPGEKSIDKVMEWMFNARDKGMTYNMGAGRNSATQADCSSAVYRSLIYGGFLEQGTWVGNTETLFQMGAKGTVMYEITEAEIQHGDIFVSGRPGASAGAAGHTGFILNAEEDTIIHMTSSKNGVAVTPRKGYMGDYRGLPVRYYRLVGANASGIYKNMK